MNPHLRMKANIECGVSAFTTHSSHHPFMKPRDQSSEKSMLSDNSKDAHSIQFLIALFWMFILSRTMGTQCWKTSQNCKIHSTENYIKNYNQNTLRFLFFLSKYPYGIFLSTRVVRKISGKRFLWEISMPVQPDNLKIHLCKINSSIRFEFKIQNKIQIFLQTFVCYRNGQRCYESTSHSVVPLDGKH